MRASGAGLKASQVFDHFYNLFESLVDDLPGIVETDNGVTTPGNGIDNNTATEAIYTPVDEYIQYDFTAPTMIKEIRVYGKATHNEDGVWTLEAFVDGAWVTAVTLPTNLAVWSAWLPVTTILTAILWRLTATTLDTLGGSYLAELELKGLRIGA